VQAVTTDIEEALVKE